MSQFQAFRVEKGEDGFTRSIVTRDTQDLPPGEVLIDVHYSSLNYKDALSATGNPGVSRNFPHTPGIDASGVVVSSDSDRFGTGDPVVVIGFDLGMGTDGGYGQQIRVPADWVVALPEALSMEDSMVLGTAGVTAALCVDKLESAGMTPQSGPVLVTGATGGVGSVAIMLLKALGYTITAVSGKPEQHEFLTRIGASEILPREALQEGGKKPLLAETYGGVVDTVGGDLLFNALKSLRYGCSLAACGLVASPQFDATVLPFILRHVNLLGVDSVQLPLAEKQRIWDKLASSWQLPRLHELKRSLELTDVSAAIDEILAGKMVGRGVVSLR